MISTKFEDLMQQKMKVMVQDEVEIKIAEI